MNNTLSERFESRWWFARSLTRGLLESLEPHELAFTPKVNLGPFWKHFRHLGRIEENYLEAVETQRAVFGFENTTYRGDASPRNLLDYLDRVDQRLKHSITTVDFLRPVDWFGNTLDTYTHFTRMVDHELLHQGMFVVYMHLLGRSFPPGWKFWGL